MSTAHEHCWLIVDIRALVRLNEARQREPVDLRAELCCHTCSAALYDVSMAQLKDLITQDHVRGDSVAQWASINPLFR